MRNSGRLLVIALLGLVGVNPALADQEASNLSHVASGPYGHCYAKSVPTHIFDPEDEPRQQGVTEVYRVTDAEDVLVNVYDWFSQRLFVLCSPVDDISVVRIGPWQRGHDPQADHLAIAFYRGGNLIKSYSTMDIAGGEDADDGGISRYKNVSASVSHYTVFASGPEWIKITTLEGPVYTVGWQILATTIDGRALTFDMKTGELR
jgi:hypothetical protein